MRLEQLLVTNGYTKEDLTIIKLLSADQLAVIISSASLLADTNQDTSDRKISEGRKISTSSIDKKVSFDCSIQEENIDAIAETETSNKN